ncbi:MAG: hypothetical protein V1913_09940 [Fibrobacterota bacterium]
MKLFLILSGLALLILSGCAPYSQLKPEPLLSPLEQGFLELKNGEKEFKLKPDNKYYVVFPAPAENNFYLVLDLPEKRKVEIALTSSLTDEKTVGPLIADAAAAVPDQIVYPVNAGAPFYWLINRVPAEMMLTLKYRYVPQWRFKFENKHAEYMSIYEKNRVDRKSYLELGTGFHFNNFNFKSFIDTVSHREAALKKMHLELIELDKLFPSSIRNSTDKAYQDYQFLKMNLEDELDFQARYLLVLRFFDRENDCRGNILGFLDGTEYFTQYFQKKNLLPANVLTESRGVLETRLKEILPHYERLFAAKTDDTPLDSQAFRLQALSKVLGLYEAAGFPPPQEMNDLVRFAPDYDTKSRAFAAAQAALKGTHQSVKDSKGMPADDFFPGVIAKAGAAQALLPAPLDASYGKFMEQACAIKLNQDIEQLRMKAVKAMELYRQSDALVRQLNALKLQKDYPGMLALLKQTPQPDFILDKYAELDTLSINGQAGNVRAALAGMEWARAESGLSRLHQDKIFLNPQKALPVKAALVSDLEDALYNKVDALTREKVDKFCIEKAGTVENVDSLYMDSVFLPAYDITFSSGTKNDLLQRKTELIAHLAKLKENEFPVKAIKLLYDVFTKNPDDSGVLKCRAIVAHSKHFTGVDKEVSLRVAECNPLVPKSVSKPTDYRRIFVLPVTDNRTGKNRYLLRINVKVPSDAKFPVFDVNLRLPREIAANAAENQWYEKLTLNGKPLKNEGRFTISAPTAANNYECQITPVQMAKDNENILEVVFEHRSFKVHNVSVMVQKPIIKKN